MNNTAQVVSVWNFESARAVQVRSADQNKVSPTKDSRDPKDERHPANRATGQEIATHDERT